MPCTGFLISASMCLLPGTSILGGVQMHFSPNAHFSPPPRSHYLQFPMILPTGHSPCSQDAVPEHNNARPCAAADKVIKRCYFGAVHQSGVGTSGQFAATQHVGRFRSEVDID